MGTIKIHPDEFANIVIAYLLDMLRDEENLPSNEEFRKIIKILGEKGAKTPIYGGFIAMDTTSRIKYKRIKESLMGDGEKDSKILISKGDTDYISEDDHQFDRELCKQIFRTIKEVRFKHPSKVLREDRIDKIIDYCIKQKKKKQEEQQNG